MSRLDILTVVIVAICLAALGYQLFKTFNMIGGGADDAPERTERADDATATDGYGADTTYDPYATDDTTGTEDFGTDADAVTPPTVADQEGYSGSATTDNDFESDYEEAPERISTQPETSTGTATAPNTGQYMVIAGTFRQKINAEQMVSRLKGMGYSETRMELFNRGRYAVALVNRFSSLTSARQLERELESKGIEAEVITD